jgi:hypothetical protein
VVAGGPLVLVAVARMLAGEPGAHPERYDRHLSRRSRFSLGAAGCCLCFSRAGFCLPQPGLGLDALALKLHLLLRESGIPFLWCEPIPLELYETLRAVGVFFRHPTVSHANPPQGLLGLLVIGIDGRRTFERSVRLSGEPVVAGPQAERQPASRILRGEALCALPIRVQSAGASNDAVDRRKRESDAAWTDLDRDAGGRARDDLAHEASAALEHDFVSSSRYRDRKQ